MSPDIIKEYMSGKNRFSKLLKHLITLAEVKNVTLAQDLQYDVSYISKWTSGQVMPAEKYVEKILRGISACVVDRCSTDGIKKLMKEYQLEKPEELKLAVYDHLEAEYHYVGKLQNERGTGHGSQTFFYPEMKLAQYIVNMQHPVLRRVNTLYVMGVFDLFSMERKYQLRVAEAENKYLPKNKWYKDVHFTMVIDIRPEKMDCTTDVIFLMELLDRYSCVDFQIYGSSRAGGKMVFAVKDNYTVSGMLMGEDHCMGVVVTEEQEYCNVIYQNLQEICNCDKRLFRKTSIRDMLLSHEYVHALLALKQSWIIGHFTEHFLPEEVFDEIVEELDDGESRTPNKEQLKKIYFMSRNILEETQIRIMIYQTAFYKLVVDHEMDFYNYRIRLNSDQIVRCLERFLDMCRKYPHFFVKIIPGRLKNEIKYNTEQCIFLSETLSYLRLNENFNNIYIVNRKDIENTFFEMFEYYWADSSHDLTSDRQMVMASVEHVLHGVTGK